MFSDGKTQSPKPVRSKASAAATQPKGKPPQQDQLDTALTSVLGELDRDEKAKKGRKPQADPSAVFENNFDDLESPHADPARLNIPAFRGAGGQRAGMVQH
jgi:hypothetical protein